MISHFNILLGVFSDAGPGTRSGLEQAVEAGAGSGGAEGVPGGDAGSGGRGVASRAVRPRGDLQGAGRHLGAVLHRAAERQHPAQ